MGNARRRPRSPLVLQGRSGLTVRGGQRTVDPHHAASAASVPASRARRGGGCRDTRSSWSTGAQANDR